MYKKINYDDFTQKPTEEREIECGFCWDTRKKKPIELFFIDRANNMRPCDYCPACGRILKG